MSVGRNEDVVCTLRDRYSIGFISHVDIVVNRLTLLNVGKVNTFRKKLCGTVEEIYSRGVYSVLSGICRNGILIAVFYSGSTTCNACRIAL